MSDGASKREHTRVDKLLFTTMRSFDENGEVEMPSIGRTLNVSQGGILLEVKKDVPFQIKVNLSMGFKDDIIDIEGEVVHLRITEDQSTEVGLRFLNMDDEQLALIRKHLQA